MVCVWGVASSDTEGDVEGESGGPGVLSGCLGGGFLQVDLNRIFRGVERSLGQTR